jgi:predicted Rossmann fold flavoprotein
VSKSGLTIAVIGGGAAGFFGAIACAEANPEHRVILFEKARQVLSKVRISGGGRCNVTHACFDPALLVQNYPRGGKALRGPFTRFQPLDTIQWFESHHVKLKTEADGRVFPITDNSETVIACLIKQAKTFGVQIRTECGIEKCQKSQKGFVLTFASKNTLECQRLLVATGSSSKVYGWLEDLGHTIIPPVPSLFTFNVTSSLTQLAGVSVANVVLKLDNPSLQQTGPLLITHWGFSGPAVLKLSAWGARQLHENGYRAALRINWLPAYTLEDFKRELAICKQHHPKRLIATESPFPLPRNLWKELIARVNLPLDLRWGLFSKQLENLLIQELHNGVYPIDGKSTYKEEFVTCGGVKLDEVDFKTMESRICPGLYFAGEVLDIDGITGGFNFQSAWTTSWIAGRAMSFVS